MSKETFKEKGYFFINNEIFNKEISANSRLVYMYLCKCADCFGKSWPSHNTIAANCSISVSSVKLAIKELENSKILTVSHRYREEGGKSSNLYMIMDRSQSKCFWCSPTIFRINVSSKAKLVYLYFCRCCNRERTCFPAHRTTATACMVSVSAVRMAIKELAEGKFLEVINRHRENNGQTSNLYTVLSPVICAVENVINKASAKLKKEKEHSTEMGQDQKESYGKRSGLVSSIQSYINRGLRYCITGGVPKYDDERTISDLRVNHI